MIELVLFSLLTTALTSGIFTLALRKYRGPTELKLPPINFPPIEVKVVVPERMFIQTQHVPADVEVKSSEEPIPVEVLEYIAMESDVYAQETRKRRVRALKQDTGSWKDAFRLLQNEDKIV